MSHFAAVLVALALVSCATRSPTPVDASEARHLKDWTLSRCIARSSGNDPVRSDAARSAAAYLEMGRSGPEVYDKLERLAAAHLARPAGGSVRGSYDTMKCIDLYNDAELDAIARNTSVP